MKPWNRNTPHNLELKIRANDCAATYFESWGDRERSRAYQMKAELLRLKLQRTLQKEKNQ